MIGFVSTRTPVKGKFVKEVREALVRCLSGNFNENEIKNIAKDQALRQRYHNYMGVNSLILIKIHCVCIQRYTYN